MGRALVTERAQGHHRIAPFIDFQDGTGVDDTIVLTGFSLAQI
jgi:hypothetical protein